MYEGFKKFLFYIKIKQGLWLWTELLPTGNPDYPQMQALVIDTEGFGGMDENVNHDTRIFLFSLLLSSFFIYNSVGSIDENALNNISLIVNLAKVIISFILNLFIYIFILFFLKEI